MTQSRVEIISKSPQESSIHICLGQAIYRLFLIHFLFCYLHAIGENDENSFRPIVLPLLFGVNQSIEHCDVPQKSCEDNRLNDVAL